MKPGGDNKPLYEAFSCSFSGGGRLTGVHFNHVLMHSENSSWGMTESASYGKPLTSCRTIAYKRGQPVMQHEFSEYKCEDRWRVCNLWGPSSHIHADLTGTEYMPRGDDIVDASVPSKYICPISVDT